MADPITKALTAKTNITDDMGEFNAAIARVAARKGTFGEMLNQLRAENLRNEQAQVNIDLSRQQLGEPRRKEVETNRKAYESALKEMSSGLSRQDAARLNEYARSHPTDVTASNAYDILGEGVTKLGLKKPEAAGDKDPAHGVINFRMPDGKLVGKDSRDVEGISKVLELGGVKVNLGVQAADIGGLTEATTVPPLPIEPIPEGLDISGATGAGGALRNLGNTLVDAVGWGLVSPDNEKATRVLKRLSTETNLVLSGASVEGKVSNYVRERLAELEASANRITQGDERTRLIIGELVITLSQHYNALAQMVNNPKAYSKKDVARAQASHRPLLSLINQYNTVLNNWGGAALTGLEDIPTDELLRQIE